MGGQLQLELKRFPSIWATYPFVMWTGRPPVTEVTDPLEISAVLRRVRIDAGAVGRYARMCGFDPSTRLPLTYPHVLAMPLHLKIFGNRAFPLRPMGLIHVSNSIECPGLLQPGLEVDVHVAARNYQRTDAGLVFDMATEIKVGGDVRVARNLRVPVALARAAGTHWSAAAAAAQGPQGRRGAGRVRRDPRHRVGLCKGVQ